MHHSKSESTIYIFGGMQPLLSDSTAVQSLYAYFPHKNKFRVMTPSQSGGRYFHSAGIINDQLYVYGGLYGGSSNSTVDNNNLKCFLTQFLVYNIPCDTWHHLPEPSDQILNILGTGRFGHTSFVHRGKIFCKKLFRPRN